LLELFQHAAIATKARITPALTVYFTLFFASARGTSLHFVKSWLPGSRPVVEDILKVTRVPLAGPDKKLKLSLNYPASVGRNMDEIVRVTDALMLSAKHSIVSGPSLAAISLSKRCWMMS
jgi:hypothetical protein